MELLRGFRNRTVPIFALVCLVTAGAWGIYAWRFAAPDGTGAGDESFADGSSPSENAGDASPTPLRATSSTYDRSLRESPLSPRTGAFSSGTEHTEGAESSPIVLDDVFDGEQGVASMRANEPAWISDSFTSTLGLIRPELVAAAAAEYERGKARIAAGDLVTARQAFSAALDRGLAPDDEAYIRSELSRIADALVFSRAALSQDPLTATHAIASGETLAGVAAQYHVTLEFLATINGLGDPDLIRVGAPLKVIRGPFHAVIDKSDHRMDIYLSDEYVRSFFVGLGTNGGTPTGTWRVQHKLMNPEWTDPLTGIRYLADDSDNPIGERWIGLQGTSGEAFGRSGFGIHGTIDPASIGENESKGCVRLIAEEVALVYDLLVDQHSRVVIRP